MDRDPGGLQYTGSQSWTRLNDYTLGFPGSSVGKESACSAGDLDSIPGSGRSPGVGKEEMTTHSSILAWRISWTEDTCCVHGVKRVGHNLVTKPPPSA